MRAVVAMNLVAVVVAALLSAGCYDFGALGGADAAATLPADLAPPPADFSDVDGGRCACGQGENCIADACVAAPATCGLLAGMFPGSVAPDGVYWLTYNGVPHRVYCDMKTGQILCAKEVGSEAHQTRTRDTKAWSVNWTSSMSTDESTCSIWNVRGDDNRPFSPLAANPKTKLTTCQALGFVRDVSIGSCGYGMNDTDDSYGGKCGFQGTIDWLVYYNDCDWNPTTMKGCSAGGGIFGEWEQQGPMYHVGVMSTADGKAKTVCATR